MHRRTVLRRTAGASLAAAGLAGCLGDGGGDDGPRSTVAGTSVETTATGCDTGDSGRATVSYDADALTVTVEGTLRAPNPCHAAAIRRARVRDGELRLAVVPQPDGSGACVQCIGAVQYRATVEVRGSLPDATLVLHGQGQTEVTRVPR